MKLLIVLGGWVYTVMACLGGESSLITIYQPMDGLGSGLVEIRPVTCYVHNGDSGIALGVGLVSVVNMPPDLGSRPGVERRDLNLASLCKLHFNSPDPNTDREVTLDATGFTMGKSSYEKETVVRAALECLRRSLPEGMKKFPVRLKAGEKDLEWMGKIVEQYNSCDRGKAFYVAE